MRATLKLFSFLRPYWVWATLAPLLMMIEVAMDLMQPRLLERIIDVGIANSDLNVILQTGLWMIGVTFVGIIGGVGCTFFAVLASQSFGADLRSALRPGADALLRQHRRTGDGQADHASPTTSPRCRMSFSCSCASWCAPMMMAGSLVMAIITAATGVALRRAHPARHYRPGPDHQTRLPALQQSAGATRRAQHGDAGKSSRRACGQGLRARSPRNSALRQSQRQPDGSEHLRCAHRRRDHAFHDDRPRRRRCSRALAGRHPGQRRRHAGRPSHLPSSTT